MLSGHKNVNKNVANFNEKIGDRMLLFDGKC